MSLTHPERGQLRGHLQGVQGPEHCGHLLRGDGRRSLQESQWAQNSSEERNCDECPSQASGDPSSRKKVWSEYLRIPSPLYNSKSTGETNSRRSTNIKKWGRHYIKFKVTVQTASNPQSGHHEGGRHQQEERRELVRSTEDLLNTDRPVTFQISTTNPTQIPVIKRASRRTLWCRKASLNFTSFYFFFYLEITCSEKKK